MCIHIYYANVAGHRDGIQIYVMKTKNVHNRHSRGPRGSTFCLSDVRITELRKTADNNCFVVFRVEAYIENVHVHTKRNARRRLVPMKNADYRTLSCWSSFRLFLTLFRIPLRFSLIIIIAPLMDVGWVYL